MIKKIVGVVSFIFGLLIIIKFPWISDYQTEKLGNAGILLGLLLIMIGLYLMKT